MYIAHSLSYRLPRIQIRRASQSTANGAKTPEASEAVRLTRLPSIANAVFYAPRRRLEAETRGSRAGLGSQVRLAALMHDLCRE